jgi:hypothetical protein
LRQQLWATDTFVDFDHSLNAAVKGLRDALGESADNPVFIETLARRGYRFTVTLSNGPFLLRTASFWRPISTQELRMSGFWQTSDPVVGAESSNPPVREESQEEACGED